ncbi:MAG: thioredoxin [Coriobacteriia bacterium]
MGSVLEIAPGRFKDEVLDSDVPVIVDFWAPWCGPCRIVGPEVERLAQMYGDKVKVAKVNVDENRELAIEYGVMSIPTIAKFEGGQMVARVVGAQGAESLAKEFGLA